MANINNIKTGNVNIPGALHSTANDGGGQVGNVVAYAGDIYDTTAGKNQATLNAEFAEGIANAGTGTGTITGATVGGNPVTESSGVLQFDAYPTVPIKSIQVDGASSALSPDNNGKVTIPAQPSVPITGINDANGNALTPVSGIVTLPQAAAAPTADTITYNNSTTYSSGSIGKALHDTITALGYEYSTSSTIATNPTHNMYYNLTGSAISSLDVSGVDVENDKEVIILFLTDSSNGCSLTLKYSSSPKPAQRIIGSTALAKGQVYVMSILRGVICLVEAPVYVQPASNS